MKINNIKYIALAVIIAMSLSSCSDFLDRPAEDSYNADNYYKTDAQCIAGVNYLYNSPWYDFQRGFIKVGEVLSGNYYWGSSPYLTFTVNSTDEDLVKMSYSLWAVVGHANTVYNSLKKASASESVKNQCMGECLLWKAMAYFYLVRSFGDVPIIHDNSTMLSDGSYSNVNKVNKADVYDYIVMTLEKSIELLPSTRNTDGRVDKYSAEGLLAKVYLTMSGVGHSSDGLRDTEDLAKAAKYAKDVIDNSGRSMLENYADNFKIKNNANEESLIAWRWSSDASTWTSQNTLQSDLAIGGFDEFGDCWGGWNGPSVDLQDAFGVSALENPENRTDVDTRRKATMMMAGDFYDYFWTDKTDKSGKKGFNYLQFIYDKDSYGKGGPSGDYQSASGANEVKHLYGDAYDHKLGCGDDASYMHSSLATHLLRLSDIYLIYAEAIIGNNGSTTDANAIDAFYKVRRRAIKSAERPSTITWADVWKERRLELAMEGDRWYDFVRRSYYDTDGAIKEIKSQRRNQYWDLGSVYKTYYNSGTWSVDATKTRYNNDTSLTPNVTSSSFTLPFPNEDIVFNKKLMDDPIHVDVRSTYSY